jgi:hypothetical protein
LRLQIVESLFRLTERISFGFQHQRWNRADENGFGGPGFAMARQIVRHLATAGRVTDMHGVVQVQMLHHRSQVVGVMVHVVPVGDRGGTPVPAPVVGDHAVAVVQEEQRLGVPVVGGQRPAVTEHDRLARTLVLEEDLDAV